MTAPDPHAAAGAAPVPGTVAGGGLAVAPNPPGRLGEAAPVEALRGYLMALGTWVDERRAELERLDEAALRATDPDAHSGDVALSMALWQSVSDRHAALLATWDSGRADRLARERMSQLLWGRMDAGGGLGVTLAEASRLSDALAAQLRVRLSFDPRASETAVRVASLRAGLERLDELVKVEPGWQGQVATLRVRVDDVATRAARGGDVAAVLAQLEVDAARAERDLVVTTASRRHRVREAERAAADLVADRVRAEAEVEALQHREDAARLLADRCRRLVARPPKFAVPDVDALGAVPQDRAALDAFVARLRTVARAMDVVERAYAAPLVERDELRGLLDSYRVMAARSGRDGAAEVRTALAAATTAVQAEPCDVPAARSAVRAYLQVARGGAPAHGNPAHQDPARQDPPRQDPSRGVPS